MKIKQGILFLEEQRMTCKAVQTSSFIQQLPLVPFSFKVFRAKVNIMGKPCLLPVLVSVLIEFVYKMFQFYNLKPFIGI